MDSLPPILIVDDDPDDVFILKRLLAKAGIRNKILAFENPLIAREYVDVESSKRNLLYVPWIVFTDYQMPDLDGLEFTKWIRSREPLSNVIVVLTTGCEDPQLESAAASAGVDRFLLKYPPVSVLRKLAGDYAARMYVGGR